MAATLPKAVTPTVVIIDDDDSVRRALGRLMKTIGRNVELFASAEEFLQALASEVKNQATEATENMENDASVPSVVSVVPSAVILDLHLPGLSGLELQDHLKTIGKNFPIVFITAYTDDHARKRALEAGAIAFLYKPFEEHALLDAVEKGLAPSKE